ncbi:type 1 glutamine amidotransferase domain-containing protein [Arenimonas oryziterrae]|uniref:type 1 glutamine amidotransferase domain-containing protein n=1 Tax=Arenimonas oryziterrae TaxID=498055 RepID=UPI0003B6707C|nr:type 1 glutamine amidotransferase domain-containing protein [Arenimonas oryziterrae]
MPATADAPVLVLLPSRDFDPSEVAVPWRVLGAAGRRLVFATPDARVAQADDLMLSGEGLDPWGWIPGLKKLRLIGLSLRANRAARRAYAQMQSAPEFLQPISHADALALGPGAFAGLLLPGGHRARGMRDYLESPTVQQIAAAFFDQDKPVAAICHGVLVLARTRSPATGRSVLHGRRTTALTWTLEKKAWDLTRFFARFWDGDYYRTYRETAAQPAGYMSVQAEVARALARPDDFCDVPADAPQHFRQASGLFRDSEADDRAAFIVRDGHYVSARWPGDVHAFARAFVGILSSNSK